ncbi:MAG: DUF433 domain-containing protein [Candidatus Hydrogenedentes bacterium]|nr:DUF433 domain-containing protein [Candidatus Hydrogenedentota bacterium]
MDWREYIEQRPDVMLGKPVIKGTRLTVELILDKLGGGVDLAELLDSYPQLRPEHVQAAQAFAADYIGFDETIWTNDRVG